MLQRKQKLTVKSRKKKVENDFWGLVIFFGFNFLYAGNLISPPGSQQILKYPDCFKVGAFNLRLFINEDIYLETFRIFFVDGWRVKYFTDTCSDWIFMNESSEITCDDKTYIVSYLWIYRLDIYWIKSLTNKDSQSIFSPFTDWILYIDTYIIFNTYISSSIISQIRLLYQKWNHHIVK